MTNIKYYFDITQGTDEWLALRSKIITASKMQSLITPTGKVANNNDSRAIVYEILSDRLNAYKEESFYNSHMERGNTFEPFARDLYSEKIAQVKECGFIVRDFGDYKIGFSPDGLVGDDGLIEIKCPAKAKHVKEICLDEEPKDAMMQMQTGLLVTGRKWCDFVSHYNGMPQRVVRVFPDLELHEKIKESCLVLEQNIKRNLDVYLEKTKHMNCARYEEAV